MNKKYDFIKNILGTLIGNRGSAKDKQANYAEDIINYTKSIEINPNDAETYNKRGFAYFNQKEYPQAIADYTKAIEIKPDYATAYFKRGLVKIKDS